MDARKVYTVIGLMSGTSVDGVDAALIQTDGYGYVKRLDFLDMSYASDLRKRIKAQFGKRQSDTEMLAVADELTLEHARIIKRLLDRHPDLKIDLIGFHGQSVSHDPDNGFTLQIGNGQLLADETGIPVIDDFRWNDVKNGGQGAPLIPLYHRALVRSANVPLPCAVLNIGGVANVTYIGEGEEGILAFDTGPGNALVDDFVLERTGSPYDHNGRLAAEGIENQDIVSGFLKNPYFAQKPPKSLDRDPWNQASSILSNEDGAATLLACTRESIVMAIDHLPEHPRAWYVCGGGRHNTTLMKGLRERLQVPVEPVDTLGWNGDALEAEGFGYLAVRSNLGLPLSLPTTTGVKAPTTGGVRHDPAQAKGRSAS